EDGIRDFHVTGVQTCALPIWPAHHPPHPPQGGPRQSPLAPLLARNPAFAARTRRRPSADALPLPAAAILSITLCTANPGVHAMQIGRGSRRGGVWSARGAGTA